MSAYFSDKEDCLIEMKGFVIKTFSNGLFRVLLDNNVQITTYLSGKIRRNHISILLGDRVLTQLTTYDLKRGRIIYRYRRKKKAQPYYYPSAKSSVYV